MAIYFDTNQLVGWPRVTAALRRLLDLTEYFQIPMFLPEPVEIELEEAWVRDLTEKNKSLSAKHKDLTKHAASIVEVGPEPTEAATAAARIAYRAVVAAAKSATAIRSIPTTTKPIRDFVELASRRHPPFNEKGHGFRDAVILWTILDHVKANGFKVCALVTQDGDFSGPEVEAEFIAIEASLARKTINELVDILKAFLEAAKREAAAADQAAAKSGIERERTNVEKAISVRLDLTEWDLAPQIGFVTILRLERIEFGEIKSVRTPFPFPEVEARVSVSFDSEVKLHSIGQSYARQPPRQMKVGEEPAALASGSGVQIGPILVTRIAEVEATALRTTAGEYRDIQVEAARLRGSLSGLAGLGDIASNLGYA
jgi:hypothetical protein